jgi:hypothetical protein
MSRHCAKFFSHIYFYQMKKPNPRKACLSRVKTFCKVGKKSTRLRIFIKYMTHIKLWTIALKF